VKGERCVNLVRRVLLISAKTKSYTEIAEDTESTEKESANIPAIESVSGLDLGGSSLPSKVRDLQREIW
jgi:hypothetical protein